MSLVTARSWKWRKSGKMFNQCPKQNFLMKVLFSQIPNTSQLEIQVYVLTLDQQTAAASVIWVTGRDFFSVIHSTVLCFKYISYPSAFMGKVPSTVKLPWIIWPVNEIQLWVFSWSKSTVHFTEQCSNSHHLAKSLLMLWPAKQTVAIYLPHTLHVCGGMWTSSSSQTAKLRFQQFTPVRLPLIFWRLQINSGMRSSHLKKNTTTSLWPVVFPQVFEGYVVWNSSPVTNSLRIGICILFSSTFQNKISVLGGWPLKNEP